jgi:hypothetical protein
VGDEGEGAMKDHDKAHSSFTGGISAAEMRGITNKKGGIMAKRRVGKHGGKKRRKHGKK